MPKLSTKWLALIAGAALVTGAVQAQDSGPLLNLLVAKGIITDQEAEDLRAELVKEYTANTSSGKLNLNSSLSEFKLSGDVRLRHQMETQAPETATGRPTVSNERTRERFRFRFNGDAVLQKGWSGGFAFETASAADSGNQTFQDGNNDYSLYLARAYIGWQASPNLSFAGGKIKNPFYTTDLVWDSDINPQGVNENYKWFVGAKDTFELRAMQLIMDDRPETAFGPAGRDAWLFAQQAVYTHWFGRAEIGNQVNSLVLAPGFMKYNASTLDGLDNETPFNGSTQGLAVITFAGEVNWLNVAGSGTAVKLYWDSGYNLESKSRLRAYGLNPNVWDDDPFAWLVGVGYGYGSGKTQGDYGVKVDYRSIGLGSLDPNLTDSDFAFGRLNQKGWKAAFSYNLTDFANLNLAYFYTQAIQDKLVTPVANLDHSQTLQVDLILKF
ncbi:MAG TPA: putative porin [Opitutus sp.]|nr:putative porin [Opitutus sp.]